MRRTEVRAGQRFAGGLVAGSMTVVLMAGCSAEEQQASTELPSASSTSAEPTPDLPPLGPADFPVPDEARVQSEAGAEAFLRYYIELLNRQQAIPSGQAISLLGPDCRDCQAIARRLNEAADAGYRIEGGRLTIDGEPGIGMADGRAEVAFTLDTADGAAYDASGQVVPDSKVPAQQGLPSGLRLRWNSEDSGWVVEALTLG